MEHLGANTHAPITRKVCAALGKDGAVVLVEVEGYEHAERHVTRQRNVFLFVPLVRIRVLAVQGGASEDGLAIPRRSEGTREASILCLP